MAFHYLIDGYNLLYALPDVPVGTLQEKRDALIRLLREKRLQGRNSLTLVFDSLQGDGGQTQQGDMQIVFTSGETADEWIGVRVRQSPNPRALVVVSNDQGIRLDVKGTGARFLTADEFLQGPQTPTHQAPPKQKPAGSAEITEELKKKWL